MELTDGSGKSFSAKVNENLRLYVNSISQDHESEATNRGDSYTIASGLVTLTTANEIGILYLKNTETRDFHMTQAVVSLGPSTGGAATDTNLVRLYRNPSTGTLISDAATGPIACNRNFSSSNTWSSDRYIGDAAATVTDGVVHSQVLIPSNFAWNLAIDEVLGQNKTIAFTVEPQDSNTSMKVMLEVLGYLRDPLE